MRGCSRRQLCRMLVPLLCSPQTKTVRRSPMVSPASVIAASVPRWRPGSSRWRSWWASVSRRDSPYTPCTTLRCRSGSPLATGAARRRSRPHPAPAAGSTRGTRRGCGSSSVSCASAHWAQIAMPRISGSTLPSFSQYCTSHLPFRNSSISTRPRSSGSPPTSSISARRRSEEVGALVGAHDRVADDVRDGRLAQLEVDVGVRAPRAERAPEAVLSRRKGLDSPSPLSGFPRPRVDGKTRSGCRPRHGSLCARRAHRVRPGLRSARHRAGHLRGDRRHRVDPLAANGEVLWEINLGSAVTGFPITYAVDGRQYVAVSTGTAGTASGFIRLTPEITPSAGNNLFVFALLDAGASTAAVETPEQFSCEALEIRVAVTDGLLMRTDGAVGRLQQEHGAGSPPAPSA